MKKYILIKEYPGSPKLGFQVEKAYNQTGYNRLDKSIPMKNLVIPINIEEYSEFWQEIIKKDYEILSFKMSNSEEILIYNNNTKCWDFKWAPGDSTLTTESALSSPDLFEIHSVKRLSDGEIFTIGDEFRCEKCKGILEEISLDNSMKDIYLHRINGKMPFGYFLCHYPDEPHELPQKVKKSLFTTEDGINIYAGNEYWVARSDKFGDKHFHWKIDSKPEIASDNIIYTMQANREHGVFWFSTKEAAEKYLLMNKRCLSINDIYEATPLDGDIYQKPKRYLDALIDIVKSKL